MSATFHVMLHCEGDGCNATIKNGGRYAKEARHAALAQGWTITKGRAPNEWHDHCPEHGIAR